MRSLIRLTFVYALLIGLQTEMGCACYRDIANEPRAGFLRLFRRVIKTRRKLFLVSDNSKDGHDSIVVPGLYETPASTDEYDAHPERWKNIRQGEHIVAVLPPGSLIRFDSLIAEDCETGIELPFATLLSGKYVSDHCIVESLVNDPFETHEPEWTAKSDYLAPQ